MKVFKSAEAALDIVEFKGHKVLMINWCEHVQEPHYKTVMKKAMEVISKQELNFLAIEQSKMKIIPDDALHWTIEVFIPEVSKYLKQVIIKNSQETFVMEESILILGAYHDHEVDVMLTESQDVFYSNMGFTEDAA